MKKIAIFLVYFIPLCSYGSFERQPQVSMPHSFQTFLGEFIPLLDKKSIQVAKASWILETTGSTDAADLKAELDTEWRLLFHKPEVYKKLIEWDLQIQDPILKRQLNILLRAFKQNQVPKTLLEKIAKEEAALAQSYAQFRPTLEGKPVSENEIREILKNENTPQARKKAWEASKEVGSLLAPQILSLVRLRNDAAKSLGYSDYFQMQLELQEVDPKWLLKTLDDLSTRSEKAYAHALAFIEREQSSRFHVPVSDLGPWAWSDPFAQEDPLDSHELDLLMDQVDIPKVSADFYQKMGVDVNPILARSDMWERPGKNQHAFCTNIDRRLDVRTLNNVKPTIKWMETVLHELGHAIYELGYEESLPWLLREPPHMITTEAMALLAGRQAYRFESLQTLLGLSSAKISLMKRADESLKRRQLIFSRWVLVMTAFESELYRDPNQDLNRLWWSFVEKYQKIRAPKNREGKDDWAAKYHIGLAPVYYFSYLLGEMFASAIQESLVKETGATSLTHKKVGQFLNHKLFSPGNRMSWDKLIQHVTGAPLTPDAWLREYGS